MSLAGLLRGYEPASAAVSPVQCRYAPAWRSRSESQPVAQSLFRWMLAPLLAPMNLKFLAPFQHRSCKPRSFFFCGALLRVEQRDPVTTLSPANWESHATVIILSVTLVQIPQRRSLSRGIPGLTGISLYSSSQSLQRRSSDGNFVLYQNIEKETVEVDSSRVRTTTRTFVSGRHYFRPRKYRSPRSSVSRDLIVLLLKDS